MSGAKNCPETPRQKMIGMMYLVLTAMLALNVSTDILNGFTLVDRSLRTTIEASDARIKTQYADFQYIYEQNPDKVKEWLDKANLVRQKADSLFDYIQTFKYEMVYMSDGKKTDPELNDIQGKSNMDVTGTYGLNQGNGKVLKQKIAEYANLLVDLCEDDSTRQEMYKALFATNEGKNTSGGSVSWEVSVFENMPLGATVTILSKFQSDIRASESEMIQYLKGQTDALDFRVNKIEALVVPNSKYVIKGGKYSAQIVLSAIDSTKTPDFFIGSRKLDDTGLYEVPCTTTGSFTYSGHIQLLGQDGTLRKYEFNSDYCW